MDGNRIECKCDESTATMAQEDERTLYVCSPVKMPLVWETRHLTDETSGKYQHMRVFIDLLKWSNGTYKWIAYPGIGERIGQSNAYSGCIGQVQRGETDLMFYLIDYPNEIENVTQGHVFLDQELGYIGSFHYAQFKPFTFERGFVSFDLTIWLTILSFLVLLRLFIAIKLRMMRRFYPQKVRKMRRSDYTYRVVTHFTGRGAIESNTVTMKTTWMVLSLFSFYISTIFYGLMGTGLVMSEPPLILENYDDLIKYNVKPTFGQELTVHHAFTKAKPGTPEHKLWTWASKKFRKDDLMIDLDFNHLMVNAIESANNQRVFVSMGIILQMVRASVCHFLASGDGKGYKKLLGFADGVPGVEKFKDNHYQNYLRFPKSLKPQMLQIIYSRDVTLKDLFHAKLRKILERGFVQSEIDKLSTFSLTSAVMDERAFFGQNKIDHQLKHDCMQAIPVAEERSADDQSFVTFASLEGSFAVFFACILISSLFYFYECRRSGFRWRSLKKRRVGCVRKKNNWLQRPNSC